MSNDDEHLTKVKSSALLFTLRKDLNNSIPSDEWQEGRDDDKEVEERSSLAGRPPYDTLLILSITTAYNFDLTHGILRTFSLSLDSVCGSQLSYREDNGLNLNIH